MANTLRAALVVLIYLTGIGWAIGSAIPLYLLFQRGALPRVGPIPLLGGRFERLGQGAFISAGLVFVVVSALRILAAYWLSLGRVDGAVLELILLGLSAIFWYGFELPLGPIFAITEVVLLVLVWGTLRA
jgi:hypothetical protein